MMMMMMMKSGELTSQNQDKLADSFSFACYDPSSDDEDDVSDAESYIEIQVQQPKHRNSLHRGPSSAREVFVFERGRRWDDAEDDDDDEEDDHIELRISISSAVPLPRISPQCFHDAIESRIGYLEEKPIEEPSSMVIRKGANWGKVRFPAVKRVLGVLFSNLKVTPEVCHTQEKDVFNVILKGKNEQLELLRPSNMTQAVKATESKVTKFLIKVRAMQIRPFFSSILKNCQVMGTRSGNKGQAKNRGIEDTVQCYEMVPNKVFRQGSIGKSRKDRDLGRKDALVYGTCSMTSALGQVKYALGNYICAVQMKFQLEFVSPSCWLRN
ncbi:hypothetical protein MLD38_029822 [Melastoma candidum]|uniref:Uncharacterized protein n=1 Tax=Melastoma candidum TaxID=119954 RepID=A0ACB9N791_9MYRT|nr:hypothetical protein MLD38_029822 [Melastoma candidum]